MKQVRRVAIALASLIALVVGVSCDGSTSTDETRRSALAGDPIESVQQVEGVAPVTITNEPSSPDGGTIDSTSFTIGLFNEDNATLCQRPTSAVGISGLPGLGGAESPCGILSDLDPLHRGVLGSPYPAFEDVSVVEVAVNVGAAKALHWDWEYKAYYQAPFGEFWAEVVDENNQTTTVIDKTSAPAPWGFRPIPDNWTVGMPPFESGLQQIDLDLTPWSGQKIKVRFVLHTKYDPFFFAFSVPPGFIINIGAYDAGPSKLYVSNLRIDACAVTSVELLDVISPILDNPAAGGGKRIFPDKPPPGTGPDRETVRVVAHTNRPNCPVTLRSFDIDDPSGDSTIDPNGPAGEDNLGKVNGHKCGGFVPGLDCQTNNVPSDADGKAVVGFLVSKQPGDNFVIIAGTDKDEVSKVKLIVNGDGSVLQDDNGNAVPNAHIAASPNLTVWRHLHVQADSMGRVTGNHLDGTITRAGRFESSGTPLESVVRLSTRLPANRFVGGRIVFNTKSFPVLDHDAFALLLEDPTGQVSSSDTGAAFVLYDDDNIAGNNEALINGDEGFDVPAPDLALLADSDEPSQNVLAPAYIRPTYDVPGDGGQPFLLNIEKTEDPFSGQMDVVSPDYWFVYLLGGYQGPVNGCWDPPLNNNLQVQGKSIIGQGGVMYLETIRDVGETAVDNGATTTAHEVGHLLGAGHGQKGLMGDNALGSLITEPVFKPKSIRAIRRRVSP